VSGESSIQWCDATWNPTRGCSVISEGCHNCYAMRQAHRFNKPGGAFEGYTKATKATKAGPQWTGKVSIAEKALDWPLRYKGHPDAIAEGRPTRIFVNSMSDLFHEWLSDEDIDRVFAVMAQARKHIYQILTKRAERMRQYSAGMIALSPKERTLRLVSAMWGGKPPSNPVHVGELEWPFPWVWLGVSAENQERADERIPDLLATPAAVRFVSAEPLLSGITLPDLRKSRNLHMCMSVSGALRNRRFRGLTSSSGRPLNDAEAKFALQQLHNKGVKVIPMGGGCTGFSDQTGCPGHENPSLDWVIVGGESGPKARPCDVSWIRSIKDQCQAASVPVFVKQLGGNVRDRNDAGFDADTHTWAEGEDTGKPVNPRAWPSVIEAEDRIEENPRGFLEEYQGAPVRIRLKDRKGGDPSEWPEDLRIRQFPKETSR